jgi:sulfonate transport system permease protein
MSGRALPRWPLALVVPAALLALWQQAATGPAAGMLAPLPDVAATFRTELRDGQLATDALATLLRALSGFLCGALAGTMLGIAMALSRPLERSVGPLFHALRQVPLLGWLPLIGLWLGNGDDAKFVIVALAAFYPSVLNSVAGVQGVDRRYREVARVLQLSAPRRFVHLLLPAAAPLILTGLSQALAFAWIAAIGAELLLGGASGLGATMSVGQAQQRIDIVLVAIVATGAIGFSLNALLLRLRRRLLRWQTA